MGKFDKQLKYSIRKVSVGAASVIIGAFYLAMGAGVVHADTSSTSTNNDSSHSSPSPEPETSQPNSLTSSSYRAEPAQNPDASGKSTESTTPKKKENKETLATNNTKPVENKEINNVAQPTEASTSANTRGRRVRREVGDAPTGETSDNSTGTETPAGSSTGNNETLNSALTERKGSTVKPDQPGVNIPKGDESGAHDPNAHLSFDDPDHTATVEDMWKIIQHMPDDFQNNERSYLKNMDTLGRELRFDKTAENPEGVPLQPGEIRELHDFGGWHAIDEDGNKGKFAIGRKNAQGYFTGWHKVGQTENGIPIIEQGGMLGADALDNIYVHEQALDRRFDYMLMLVKGRTRANRNDTVADKSTYDPRADNERAEAAGANYNMLPFLEKDKFKKYSPGVVGYNGIEKKFTAFSTKYGSRVRVDFVTGYITDINGSKGSYRVVIKAQNSKGEETKVYDETISRVAEIVQNEELYKKGLNVEAAHANILKFLKDEFNYRVNKILNPKIKNSPLNGIKKTDYDSEQQKLYDQIVEEATEEAKKQGDIVMNVTEDFLSITKAGKKDSEWKKTFTNTAQSTAKLSNDLNNLLKNADEDNPNTPTWLKTSASQAKADDRAYKLLNTLIPGAKKITYHVNDDQLEVETDKYTYTAARNGSKEVGIQGSDIAATLSADAYGANPQTFDRENTNTKANNLNHGWATSSSEEFKHFSKFLGVDKGIVRTNVISDEELSTKIKEAVGPGYSKLGKAGYFATADIPLGTDIVSYTVQVIPSDNERVGVNPQSSRIQYNMPILADFSVIQDTVEPSKEVAKRILTKLKEQGKITGDQEKKIKEEIDKSKKTSEVRAAMSGDVTVRYVDTDGNNLPITDADAKKAGEKTDNGYLVRKDVLIGTDYDVNSKKVSSFKATNGKYYALRSVGGGLETSSDTPNGSITKKNTVITFVYEERTTPPTGKGVVHFKKQVSETATEALTGYNDITLEGEVGKEFSTDEVNTKITELKNAGYEIVGDTFTSGDKTVDTIEDTEGQIPSQEYTITVKEKVVTVTEPPTPNTPVDPNVPEGPKWPTTGLAKSDLEKEVTRTITYVKKDTADGPEIADAKPTVTQTAHFKRSATYNAVTGTITYGNWESADKELAKVDTPTLTGYVADKASVDKVETNADSTGLDQKVVYTKLGSWVPKVPGVETPTPLPYPNHPTDPTKPGDPTDPNTPNVPVIPYVPGYTPKIGETPLEPVDPNNPENGYKVPPIPNTPGEDTPIEYSKDPQKAVVKVFNTTTGTEVELPEEKVELSGKTGEPIPADSVTAKIADLEKRGYIVENKDLLNDQKFDKEKDSTDGDPTQVFKLLVKERTITVTEPKNPNDPVDPDKPEGPKWPATGLAKSDLEKEVTRTITYVKKETADGPEIADAKPTKKQTAHFKRSATYNLVTKVVTPGEWTSTDKTLEAVPTEKLDGYVANVPSVEEVETNANLTNLDRKVVYTKLGSWVPKVPGVETPTPLPYPNHPTDPTKPGDPTDPNTPNVPVIPYVPGYTPKIGETPLQPKVPNDPTQGYIPPAVPTEPGKDTPITYEKVPNTPNPEQPETTGTKEVTRTIKYVDEKGNELAKPSTDKVTFKGKGSDWNAVGGDSTFDAVKSPVVKGYILKDPAQKVVAERKGITPTVANQTIEVVYKKLGSWIPKVPGVETPTPLPYPNHPTDPTKPGDPTDPNTPNVPVIPYVPGYTPKIGETPLEPVDPNNPENGYKVPPIPNTPGEDTPIEYSKDPQKAVVKVFNTTTGTEVELPEEKVELSGKTGEPIPADSVTAKIADLEKRGYIVENKDLLNDQKFDKEKDSTDGDPTQVFKLLVKERTITVTEPKNPNDPVDPDKPEGPKWPATGLAKSDLEKEVTRTINYVDETGNKVSEPSTDKVTFTREAKINVVTGEITYGEWKAVGGDSTFDKVSSPVVKGYILKDPTQKEVAERKGITPTVTNQTIEVVYKKLGSWVPKVPGVETPTPLPYPNNPTDPTKPGDPTDPNTPNVPVIPYVPGYTPKTPDGNPLVPVDPNDPTQGYIPPVATEPGKDTPIEYVKVPNTPIPEEPVKPTPESNHITIWVDENGKPLKPEKPGTHEPGNIPGYRLITTVIKDGVTIHKFEKITPVEPNNPVPQKPTTPNPTPQDPTIPTPESQIPTQNTPEANTPTSETSRREELPNTGTEANANLGALGLLGALSGFVLLSRKKKED